MTLWQDLSVGTKFKIVSQVQGQISRSQFSKKWPVRGGGGGKRELAFHKHSLFFLALKRLAKCNEIDQYFNPFQTSPGLRVCCTSLLKTLREKEKLLVTSNFSFSHSVFCPFWELSDIFIKFKIVVCKVFQFGRVQNLSFGKGLNRHMFLGFCKPSLYYSLQG